MKMGETVEVRRVQRAMGEQLGKAFISVPSTDLAATVADAIAGRALAQAIERLTASPMQKDYVPAHVQALAAALLSTGTHPADAADEA